VAGWVAGRRQGGGGREKVGNLEESEVLDDVATPENPAKFPACSDRWDGKRKLGGWGEMRESMTS